MFKLLGITIFFYIIHAPSTALADANADWEQYEKNIELKYKAHEEKQISDWDAYKKRISLKWKDAEIPEEKTFVDYSNNDLTRIKVDYENGTVTAETLIEEKEDSIEKAKEEIQKVFKSSVDEKNSLSGVVNKEEIISDKSSLVEKIESISKDTQFKENSASSDNVPRKLYSVTLKMVPNHIKLRAEKFRPIVEEWAHKYNLDPAYVLGIIRQESCFNPRARSSVGAIGLMQIMPKFAGREVLQTISGKDEQPDAETLYDPIKNIMFGTTYLQLLRDKHFPEIKDQEKSMYLMTASYNWGPDRIKNSIRKGRLSTREPANILFDQILKIAPEETKGYLKKVREYKDLFSKRN